MGYGSLKELIRAIRACKTAAEERKVIHKESAYLRTAFKEEHVDMRQHNVAKLLYIHMLGYPAHFGQIECLKLVAGVKFADKRLGYLGISLLLDENQETLTLVTNSLKNDMNHSNMYIVGLALGTLGNIASVEVAQDLTDEVEKLLDSSNSYIRKKAALCALRIIHKVPDLYEQYLERAITLITDKSHGVMLTGVTLIEEMCKIDENVALHFKKTVPILVKRLKALATTSSFLPELDVNGVTDPFLQVKILKLLRTLGEGDGQVSESMNDVLAQVATNTDGSKNAGNSILYETVLTIMDIESDSDLRVMAINILGRFLANKDNNTRYVALTTLNKAVAIDLPAVQRHRNTILECLQDPDVSIKRRALDLALAIVDEANIRILTRELLVFLESSDAEFKQDTAIQICVAAERFAPNRRWHIDTIIRVLKLAGNLVNEDIVAGLTRLISQSPDLHAYSVQKLYYHVKRDASQESLVLAAVWTIGEFANILVNTPPSSTEESMEQPIPSQVLDLLISILHSKLAYNSTTVQQYTITALMKLTSRFADQPDASQLQQKIQRILVPLTRSLDVEVQQRVLEYVAILEAGDIRVAVFEPMPAQAQDSKLSTRVRRGPSKRKPTSSNNGTPKAGEANLLLDLLGDVSPSPTSSQSTQPTKTQGGGDLLADLLGSTSLEPTSTQSSAVDLLGGLDPIMPTSTSNSNSLPTSPLPVSPPQSSQSNGYPAYNKGGLQIALLPQVDPSGNNVVNVKTSFRNRGPHQITNLSFQVAVPKTQKVQLQPPSSTNLDVNADATQLFRIANPTKQPIKLRLRVSFAVGGQPVEEIVDFSGFPDHIR